MGALALLITGYLGGHAGMEADNYLNQAVYLYNRRMLLNFATGE